MATTYDDTPEVAPQNLPEVVYQHPYDVPKEGQSPVPGFTPIDGSTVYSNLSPYQQYAQPVDEPRKEGKTVCGCPMLVFVLACLVAVLSAGVIGLAAGTGIEASKASDYSNQLAALSASMATQTACTAPSSTPFNVLTNGCSNDPLGTNRKTYTPFSLFATSKFTMFCNKDTAKPPLMGLFVADFNACMDACASWTKYMPDDLNSTTSSNVTCGAVSFIPLWTDKTVAKKGGAPGNCYLKPGPFNESFLQTKDIGTEVHAAIGTYLS